MYKDVSKKYTIASHNNTSKVRQVIMLYEGMIKFIVSGKSYMESDNLKKSYEEFERAKKISIALRKILDFGVDEDIAKTLENFYNLIETTIISVNINQDIVACNNLVNLISAMKDIWLSIEQDQDKRNIPDTNIKDLEISI